MRFIKRNAIALVALVFAMTGTGIAASRYIITSSSQIKPSVLRELHTGAAHAAEVKLAKKGAKAVVARPHLAAPLTVEGRNSGSEQIPLPLAGASFTQKAEETLVFAGGFAHCDDARRTALRRWQCQRRSHLPRILATTLVAAPRVSIEAKQGLSLSLWLTPIANTR